MADIAMAVYTGATIWFFFTGFTRPTIASMRASRTLWRPPRIAEGVLDQIQNHPLRLCVWIGGGAGLADYHNCVDDLRESIEWRAASFAPLPQKYNGTREPRGTVALWSDLSDKKEPGGSRSCGT
jgi:hypothetical protein